MIEQSDIAKLPAKIYHLAVNPNGDMLYTLAEPVIPPSHEASDDSTGRKGRLFFIPKGGIPQDLNTYGAIGAIAPNGDLWSAYYPGHLIAKLGTASFAPQIPGGNVFDLAISPAGGVWVTLAGGNQAGPIMRLVDGQFQRFPGVGHIISVTVDERPWVINRTPPASTGVIYKKWERAGPIFEWAGTEYIKHPLMCVDVSTSADGQVWLIDMFQGQFRLLTKRTPASDFEEVAPSLPHARNVTALHNGAAIVRYYDRTWQYFAS